MDYVALKAEIQDYLHGPDISAKVDLFIGLFESYANRELRVAQMETSAAGDTVALKLVLPSDYLEMRRVKTGDHVLEYVTPDRLSDYHAGVYTIIGNELQTNANATLEYSYYQAIPALSATNTSNWLLADYPDLYLYGCVAEATLYARDDTASTYIQFRDRSINDIRKSDKKARWSGAPIRVNTSNKFIV